MKRCRSLLIWTAVLGACAHSPPIAPEAKAQGKRCYRQLSEGDLEGAERSCDEAIRLSPDYPAAWLNKGIVELREGKKENARKTLDHALDLNPKSSTVQDALGILEFRAKRYGAAYDRFSRAVELEPNWTDARYHAALAAHLWGRDSLSRKEISALAEIEETGRAENLLAILLLDSRRPQEGIRWALEALKRDPANPAFWSTLGYAYGLAGRGDDGAYALTACLEIDPRQEECRQNAAHIFDPADLVRPAPEEPYL